MICTRKAIIFSNLLQKTNYAHIGIGIWQNEFKGAEISIQAHIKIYCYTDVIQMLLTLYTNYKACINTENSFSSFMPIVPDAINYEFLFN